MQPLCDNAVETSPTSISTTKLTDFGDIVFLASFGVSQRDRRRASGIASSDANHNSAINCSVEKVATYWFRNLVVDGQVEILEL